MSDTLWALSIESKLGWEGSAPKSCFPQVFFGIAIPPSGLEH